MDTAYHIRSADPDDINAILSLLAELAAFEDLADQVVATESDFHSALFGTRRVAEALVVTSEEAVVAYAIFFHNFSTFLGKSGIYLEDLYVQQAHRSKGIGTALLKHIASLAVQRGCARFEWSVLNWNKAAIRRYRGVGAKPLDEWTVFRCDGDALIDLAES